MKKIILSYVLSLFFLLTGLYITSTVHKNEQVKTVRVLCNGEVLNMPAEEYVLGVVCGEMPSDFEEEALKAQAVAARTYMYYKINKADKHKNADICTDSTCCCAYYSYDELYNLKGEQWIKNGYEKIKRSVAATAGEIVTYENKPVLAVFHSAAGGGRTENSEDVWASALPYLRSVETAGESEKSNYETTVTFEIDEFKGRIKNINKNADFSGNPIGEIKLTDGGAVDYIFVYGIKLKGTEMRSIFGLKSACFDVKEQDRKITFTVTGSGHGVGMSQYGANYMAKQGKTYKEILSNYYYGTEINNVLE